MFYKHEVLAKKGEFGIIWLAGTVQSKFKQYLSNAKREVERVCIEEMSNRIVQPPAPLSLRTQSALLRGLVIVYSRKVVYLETDMNNFFARMQKMWNASSTAQVDLPDGKLHARVEAITIAQPEDSMVLPLLEAEFMIQDASALGIPLFREPIPGTPYSSSHTDSNQARLHDITLQEMPDFGGSQTFLFGPETDSGHIFGIAGLEPLPAIDDSQLPTAEELSYSGGSGGRSGGSWGGQSPAAMMSPALAGIELFPVPVDGDLQIAPQSPVLSVPSSPGEKLDTSKKRKRVVGRKNRAVDVSEGDTQIPAEQMKQNLADCSELVVARRYGGMSDISVKDRLSRAPGFYVSEPEQDAWKLRSEKRFHDFIEREYAHEELFTPAKRRKVQVSARQSPAEAFDPILGPGSNNSDSFERDRSGGSYDHDLPPIDLDQPPEDLLGPLPDLDIAEPESLRAVFESSPRESSNFMLLQQRGWSPARSAAALSMGSARSQNIDALRPPSSQKSRRSGSVASDLVDEGGIEMEAFAMSDVKVMPSGGLSQWEETMESTTDTQTRRASFTTTMDIRSYKMKEYLAKLLEAEGEPLSFSTVVRGGSKGTVARAFFQLLVLSSNDFIKVQQDGPFGQILLRYGEMMTAVQ